MLSFSTVVYLVDKPCDLVLTGPLLQRGQRTVSLDPERTGEAQRG